ncbi:MAG: hypothetical protein QOI11_1873, partial [Candidatus Eremiobacteraeota bacterium]|nr:hypothetical protein [Candidatus Eremiobacteraeota bacterium]
MVVLGSNSQDTASEVARDEYQL